MSEPLIRGKDYDTTFRQWCINEGKVMMQIEYCFGHKTVKTEYKLPSEIEGYSKEAIITILFLKQVPSMEELNETVTLIFKQEVHVKIREDDKDTWLFKGDNKKYFVKVLAKDSQYTYPMPFNSDERVIITKSKPIKITLEEAKIIETESAYFFDKMVTNPETNETEYMRDVSRNQ